MIENVTIITVLVLTASGETTWNRRNDGAQGFHEQGKPGKGAVEK